MNALAPSNFVDFIFKENTVDLQKIKELSTAAKYGTKETIKPLLDSIEAELVFLEDALQDVSDDLKIGEELLRTTKDAQSWLMNLDISDSQDVSDLQEELISIFQKRSPDVRQEIISNPESMTYQNALDLSERILHTIDTSCNDNSKWIKLGEDRSKVFTIKALTDTMLNKVGLDSNPVPDMNLFGATSYDKAMTQMLHFGIAMKLYKQSGLSSSQCFLNDYDRDHKDMGRIMTENAEALGRFLNDTWKRFELEDNESSITRHYNTDIIQSVRDNVANMKSFIGINENLTAGWSTMQSSLNEIDSIASDIIQAADSLTYVREEVERIFSDHGVRRYDSDFKAPDSSHTDWYEEYFDYDSEHPGFIEMKELVEPYFETQDKLERNLEFLKDDLRSFESTILEEQKRHRKEGKELIKVGQHWDRVLER